MAQLAKDNDSKDDQLMKMAGDLRKLKEKLAKQPWLEDEVNPSTSVKLSRDCLFDESVVHTGRLSLTSIYLLVWTKKYAKFFLYKSPCLKAIACQLFNKETCEGKTCHFFSSARANKTCQRKLVKVKTCWRGRGFILVTLVVVACLFLCCLFMCFCFFPSRVWTSTQNVQLR